MAAAATAVNGDDNINNNEYVVGSEEGKRKKVKWSKEDDERLLHGISIYGSNNSGGGGSDGSGGASRQGSKKRKRNGGGGGDHNNYNWVEIAKLVVGKTHQQCLARYRYVLHPDIVRGHFTKEEDELILKFVEDQLKQNGGEERICWSKFQDYGLLPHRSPQQVWERWVHQLSPEVNKSNFTEEEDNIILKKQSELGNSWAQIAKFLPGRNSHQIKIRYRRLFRASKRKIVSGEDSTLIIDNPFSLISGDSTGSGENVSSITKRAAVYSRNSKLWSTEEDERLLEGVKKFKKGSWVDIAKYVGTKSNQQCSRRYRNTLQPEFVHGNFTEEEDKLINKLVQEQLAQSETIESAASNSFEEADTLLPSLVSELSERINWNLVRAGGLQNRSLSQLRQRWSLFLSPNLKTAEFSPEEDDILLSKQLELGNAWVQVAKFLPGRTNYQVMKRFSKLSQNLTKKFSSSEEKLLKEVLSKKPEDWNEIAAQFSSKFSIPALRLRARQLGLEAIMV